ncbi:MAG: hypothetical protein RIS45_301, partial [Planctomycetota bacterium]
DSMSDLFHEDVPFEFIDRVFAVMALTPRHTYQVLTKRPERMAEYFNDFGRANIRVYDAATEIVNADFDRFPGDMASKRSSGGSWWPLPNVWLGTSVEDQARADERIPHLLRCPASVRFLSVEPLLGHVDLEFQPKACPSCGRGDFITTTRTKGADTICGCAGERCADAPLLPTIDWVIVGGESGAHARPCDVRWIESVVTQCKAAGVPVFVKQLGARVWAQDRPAPYSREEPHGRLIEAAPPDYLFSFKNRKGSDPEEWPSYLRVREWPVGFVPSSL